MKNIKRMLRFWDMPWFRYSKFFTSLKYHSSYRPREEMIKIAIDFIVASRVRGDYAEFGVFKGDTFVAAYHFAKRLAVKGIQFFAFDSFEGLPEITGTDANGFKHYTKGQYAFGVSRFIDRIQNNGVDMDNVTIVPGFFDKSLSADNEIARSLYKVAIAWVDCDLYESTVPVLEYLTPRVQDGTVLIFDDWFCFKADPNRGEQKALSEWLSSHPEITVTQFRTFGWHGNSFIVHKK